MRSNLNQVFQFGVLAFTILGAAATVLSQQKQYVALLAVAPVAVTVWLLCLRALVEMYALVANRHWLERHLQALVNEAGAGCVFVPWDDAAGKVARKSFANATVFAAFAAAATVICAGSLLVAWQELSRLRTWIVADTVICGIFAIATVISAMQVKSIPGRIEQLLAENARP